MAESNIHIRLKQPFGWKSAGTYILLAFLLIASFHLSGQVCDGNLGQNIFSDGDFGSGNTNVVSTDPQIAPGYIYQPHPPPNDGYYTITNYTGLWNLFPGWIKIRDNSPDDFGYMMVVNASHQPGLFYENEITGLCENTLYEFSADIINLMEIGSNAIKPNVSFLLDGVEYYDTGIVPEDEEWNTYGFTFTTNPDQSSLTLSLRNNAPGGIGNDLALDNISFRPCGPKALILPEEIADICEDGDPIDLEVTLIGDAYDTPTYQWQQSFDQGATWDNIQGETGETFTHTTLSAGTYYYRYLVANGPGNISNYKCRISSNIKLVHVIPKFNTVTDTICDGLTYTVGNSVYSKTGIYTDSLVNRIGCDSIITLNLTVVEDPKIDAEYILTNPSCSYLQDGRFAIDSIIRGTQPYAFFFEEEPYDLNETAANLQAGEYVYLIIDRYGCSLEETVTVLSPLPFVVNLGDDQEVDLGDPVLIIPEANYSVENYLWEPADLVECEGECLELNWSPPYSMYIAAVGTSTNKCNAADSVYVTVNKTRKAWFPNAFSPNNDGLNDYFTVFGALPNVKRVEKMSIFDRWGKLIFEKYDFVPNEPTSGWDGTFNGRQLEPGTFVYVISIRFLDDEIISYSGDVTIVR